MPFAQILGGGNGNGLPAAAAAWGGGAAAAKAAAAKAEAEAQQPDSAHQAALQPVSEYNNSAFRHTLTTGQHPLQVSEFNEHLGALSLTALSNGSL